MFFTDDLNPEVITDLNNFIGFIYFTENKKNRPPLKFPLKEFPDANKNVSELYDFEINYHFMLLN